MSPYLQILLTFICGGFLCAIAQVLIDLTRLTPARILVAYVCSGVILYAVGIYEPLFKIFGCGVSVPLIGFGATIGKGVYEEVSKTGLLGAFTGGLSASAAGITVALLCGLVLSVFCKGKSKRL